MADTKDNRLSCDELEELVPELLYGELDDDRAEQVRAQLPACELDGKVAAYERMREAFRSLPDEEPPPAISAQLLHAAAKQVEGKSPDGVGFWDKLRGWFSPLIMHPGLAAAASILVVGGVVGVLYLKSSDQIAQPDVATRASAPELREPAPAAPAPAGTTATLDGRLNDQLADEEVDDEAEADESAADAPTTPPPKASEKPELKRSKKTRPSNRRGREAGNDKARIDATGKSSGLLDGDARGYGEGANVGDTVGPATRGEAAPPAAPPAADPAPAPEPAPDDDAPRSQERAPQKKAPAKKDKADPHAGARRLHDQARSAAERGDCTSARKLTARIQKTDPVYYRDAVRDDRQLRKCQNVGK